MASLPRWRHSVLLAYHSSLTGHYSDSVVERIGILLLLLDNMLQNRTILSNLLNKAHEFKLNKGDGHERNLRPLDPA